MKVTKIPGGPLPTNCYLLTEEQSGLTAVVDPGFESENLTERVLALGKDQVKLILLTHAHFDHITGVAKLKELTGAKVYLHSEDLPFVSDGVLNGSEAFYGTKIPEFQVDVPMSDGDEIKLGSLNIRVLHTPGHTIGGCCFLVGNALFTGDTLMQLSCGRTDFPTGSYRQMLGSLQKLANLPGNYHLYPGHGAESTLDFERKNNSFIFAGTDTHDTLH
ncbi:MAG: MBL fold metallo-hydrolase [Oscillospiraceae bacterium]|jgi:glyoxylase-like metal-dependent hydrolase (beta-lactamase superfamily II)|nr:MBL fold metallo-hydrolase [Oscillospiraceae bacterium]